MTNSYHALGDTLRKLNTDDLVFIKRDGSMLIFETTSVLGAQKIVEKLSVRISLPWRNRKIFCPISRPRNY